MRNKTFQSRVNMAANYISQGRTATRSFDNCFEMWDGDAVAVALYRRSRKNPKLRVNLWRYISRATTVSAAFKYRRIPTRGLRDLSAKLIAEAKEKSAAMFERQRQEQEAIRAAGMNAGYTVKESETPYHWDVYRPDGSLLGSYIHEDSAWYFAGKDALAGQVSA
jgi:hypothetical protein